jgi:hypothetical protein
MYPPDPNRIPDLKIPSEFSYREYDGDPNDTSGIQRIQRIQQGSKGYDQDPRDTGSSVSAMYREGIGCIATVSSELSPYPG